VENINTELKNTVEEATGLDLDRDGGVGAIQKIQENGDNGTGVQVMNPDSTHKGRGSGTIKISDTPTQMMSEFEILREEMKSSPEYDKELFDLLMNPDKKELSLVREM
jgi:hypothetical protein